MKIVSDCVVSLWKRAPVMFCAAAFMWMGWGCSSFTSTAPSLTLPANQTPLSLNPVWSAHLDGHSFLVPAVNGETLYVGITSGKVQALDVRTGSVQWTRVLPTAILGALSANLEMVLVSTAKGDLLALDSVSGRTLWEYPLGRRLSGPIQFFENNLVVWTDEGGILLLDGRTHKEIWLHETDRAAVMLRTSRTGTVALGGIFTGTPKGKLMVLDPRSGRSFWDVDVPSAALQPNSDPLVDTSGSAPVVTSNLACGSNAQRTVCADVLKGTVKWSKPFGTLAGLETDGLNFVGISPAGTVFALNERSGELVWKYTAFDGNSFLKPELLANSVWIAPTTQPLLVRLDAETGHYQSAYTIPAAAQWFRAVERTLIIQTNEGHIVSYGIEDSSVHKKTQQPKE